MLVCGVVVFVDGVVDFVYMVWWDFVVVGKMFV